MAANLSQWSFNKEVLQPNPTITQNICFYFIPLSPRKALGLDRVWLTILCVHACRVLQIDIQSFDCSRLSGSALSC